MEVYGVGPGLDLSPYYGRCRTIGKLEGTGYRVFRDSTGLFAATIRSGSIA